MGFTKTTASWFSVLSGDKKVEKFVNSEDAVDAMERGFARALASDEAKPEATEAPTRKMRVERSEDRLVHVLFNEQGTPMLEARVEAEGVKVFRAGAGGALKAAIDVPAFTITHDKEKTNWKIASSFCGVCQYRNPHNSCKNHGGQTLALVRHGKEEIGEGVAMCMDVDIPEIAADGQSAIWCPLCKGCDDSRIELSSLRPKWNQKLKSLSMDFKGKVDAASAKNFQLCLGDDVVLVFGKKANGSFCLEFEHPLSAAQAFTIALTTNYWT